MFKAFITLFTEADVLFFILLALCIALLVAEVFIPSFGIVGLGGLLMGFGAVTIRCTSEGNTPTEIIFYIIYTVLIIFAIVGLVKLIYKFCLVGKSKKRTVTINGNKVPATKDGKPDYSFLVGKSGEVVSDLRPIGKANIEGRIFEVNSDKEYIYTGTIITVVKIEDQRIIVKKKG